MEKNLKKIIKKIYGISTLSYEVQNLQQFEEKLIKIEIIKIPGEYNYLLYVEYFE